MDAAIAARRDEVAVLGVEQKDEAEKDGEKALVDVIGPGAGKARHALGRKAEKVTFAEKGGASLLRRRQYAADAGCQLNRTYWKSAG